VSCLALWFLIHPQVSNLPTTSPVSTMLGLSKASCVCKLYVSLEILSHIIVDQKWFQFYSSTTTTEHAFVVRDQLSTFGQNSGDLLPKIGLWRLLNHGIYYICVLHVFQLSHMHIVLCGSLILLNHHSEKYCLGLTSNTVALPPVSCSLPPTSITLISKYKLH
jgi:hypothetical protein